MEELYAKRDELRDQIKRLRADLTVIERAIRVFDAPRPRKILFKRGHLQRIVFDAMREGIEGNKDIARYVLACMDWECTDEALADMTMRVKDVTKRL